MTTKIAAALALAAALTAAPFLPAGAGPSGHPGLTNAEIAAGEVPCRLPNGQTVRLTPHECAARGGTVTGG